MIINKANMYALALLFIFFLGEYPAEADEIIESKPTYSVEQLQALQKSMEPRPWLDHPEQKVNLRNEEDYELLLKIRGYARGGTFVVFPKSSGAWSQISDGIEQAHHPLHILKKMKTGMILKHSFRHWVAVALRYGFLLMVGMGKNMC
jgi:hypothetical protein